jgi:hypothetical protein
MRTLAAALRKIRLRGPGWRLGRWALFLPLILVACKDELFVSGPDALTDPRFAPTIISSWPALNTTGPYAAWTVSSYNPIDIRFSKLMDAASVARGLTLTSSIRPEPFDLSVYPSTELQAEFILVPNDAGGYLMQPPKIGEVLTLRAARPLVDVNGNALAPRVLGTLTPEPYFRVTKMQPPNGGTLYEGYTEISLAFNSPVDTSILRYISIVPAPTGPWRLSTGSPYAATLPTSALPRARSYAVRVDPLAHDTAGNRLAAAFSAAFVSGQFTRTTYVPLGDTTQVPLFHAFEFSFSSPVDTASVRSAVRISPDVAGGLLLDVRYNRLEIRPAVEYAPARRYSVTIDTTLRSTTGSWLNVPIAFAFTTDVFRVARTLPPAGSTGASVGADLEFYFTARLDSSTIRKSLIISPPLDGLLFPAYGRSSFTYYLADSLRSHTTYTVTIDTTIRSQSGLRMEAPYTYTFTTGPAE